MVSELYINLLYFILLMTTIPRSGVFLMVVKNSLYLILESKQSLTEIWTVVLMCCANNKQF